MLPWPRGSHRFPVRFDRHSIFLSVDAIAIFPSFYHESTVCQWHFRHSSAELFQNASALRPAHQARGSSPYAFPHYLSVYLYVPCHLNLIGKSAVMPHHDHAFKIHRENAKKPALSFRSGIGGNMQPGLPERQIPSRAFHPASKGAPHFPDCHSLPN